MGQSVISEHFDHVAVRLGGSADKPQLLSARETLRSLEMGGMFIMGKVRDGIAPGDFRDPGWYRDSPSTMAPCVSTDRNYGKTVRRSGRT